MNNTLQIRVRQLKLTFPAFKFLTQLKGIQNEFWIKENGIRKAQYLSGIKYASSILRYKTTKIRKLKTKLNFVHPTKRLL